MATSSFFSFLFYRRVCQTRCLCCYLASSPPEEEEVEEEEEEEEDTGESDRTEVGQEPVR